MALVGCSKLPSTADCSGAWSCSGLKRSKIPIRSSAGMQRLADRINVHAWTIVLKYRDGSRYCVETSTFLWVGWPPSHGEDPAGVLLQQTYRTASERTLGLMIALWHPCSTNKLTVNEAFDSKRPRSFHAASDSVTMILRFTSLTLLAAVLSLPTHIACLEVPPGTPVSSLISSAKAHLAKGDFNDALQYFDAAISRDPSNYLSIFQRGATYLSLGRNNQATADFDKVLSIKPDFEAALLQRARIKAKNADWAAAREDYGRAGKKDGAGIAEIEEAQGAAILAQTAENSGNWEDCISHAGVAIMTASTALPLRLLRARCRFERV